MEYKIIFLSYKFLITILNFVKNQIGLYDSPLLMLNPNGVIIFLDRISYIVENIHKIPRIWTQFSPLIKKFNVTIITKQEIDTNIMRGFA
jgi:hypothetical protein